MSAHSLVPRLARVGLGSSRRTATSLPSRQFSGSVTRCAENSSEKPESSAAAEPDTAQSGQAPKQSPGRSPDAVQRAREELSRPSTNPTKPVQRNSNSAILDLFQDIVQPESQTREPVKRHYMHVFAHKHNTHITICGPDKGPMKRLSLSTGNLGFRKSNRGTYDAAYQLANYTLGRIQEQGLLPQIQHLEVIMRGFGVGRDAVTKVLLGQEGSIIRNKIGSVSDGTRLKFGGTRSKKPRRLG